MSLPSKEQWRPIPGWDDLYEVSDHGRVRGRRRRGTAGGLLQGYESDGGYIAIRLTRDRRQHSTMAHRLVALAFLGPRPEGEEVRHLNGDPGDNRLSNLRYGTKSQNQLDTVRHGTHAQARKTHCPQGHEYTPENTEYAPSRPNTRYCYACRHKSQRIAA